MRGARRFAVLVVAAFIALAVPSRALENPVHIYAIHYMPLGETGYVINTGDISQDGENEESRGSATS